MVLKFERMEIVEWLKKGLIVIRIRRIKRSVWLLSWCDSHSY